MVFAGLYPVEGSEDAQLRESAREASAQRRVLLLRAGNVGGARALGSAADSSASCTWRSCRSGSSASSIRSRHHCAGRSLSRDDHRRPGARDRQSGQAARPGPDRAVRGAGITAMMLTPSEHVGAILALCQEKRGVQKGIEYFPRIACSSPTSCRSTRSCSTSTIG